MQPDAYSTVDLWEASFLRARGVILTAKRTAGERTMFLFGNRSLCEQLHIDYVNNAPVPISSLKAAFRDLKQLIFDDSHSS